MADRLINHYREIVVERSDVYIIPMFDDTISTINGWTLEQITEDWFERFTPNSSHATLDSYRIGGASRFIHAEVVPWRIGGYVPPSLEPNGPTPVRTNTGSMSRKGLLTGIKDRNGTPICIGDTIRLDLYSKKEPDVIVVEYIDQSLNVGFEVCKKVGTVIKFWDRG